MLLSNQCARVGRPGERSSRSASFASCHVPPSTHESPTAPARVACGQAVIVRRAMFALTHGELAMVLFLFALVWGAGLLPRLAERLGARFARVRPARGSRSPRDGG